MLTTLTTLAFICPFISTPDWGAMTKPSEWNRTYEEYQSSELVPVPKYDIKLLTKHKIKDLGIQREKGTKRQKRLVMKEITAKQFYSTRFMGAYDLDAKEYSGDHKGVDLKEPFGTPVMAVGDGVVKSIENIPKLTGQTVVITHENGYESLYGHLNLKVKVKVGQKISSGTIIGITGKTGNYAGPHLHIEILKDGVLMNPMNLISCP